MKLFIIVASILVILLNVFDSYSTYIIMSEPVGGKEVNPYLNYLMGLIGIPLTLIITKSPFIMLLIWASTKALYKESLSNREFYAVVSSYCGIIVFYSYIMIFYNLEYFMI